MAITDRWHLSHPDPEKRPEPCRCSRGKNKLYPSSEHGRGRRWLVRWVDPDGELQKRSFADLQGDDPERHAEAWDAKVKADLDAGRYVDPDAGKITLAKWAATWRAGLTTDPASLEVVDKHLAHITGPPLGPHHVRVLARRPSAVQQWVKGLEAKGLAPGYIRAIVHTLSTVFAAAIEDDLAAANPVKSRSVRTPKVPKKRITPWTLEMVKAAAIEVDRRQRSAAMVYLGAGAALRESEIFAFAAEDIVWLGADRKILVRRQVKRIAGTLVFAAPKGEKDREVPLHDQLADQLADQIRGRRPVEVTLPWRRPDGPPHTAELLFAKADNLPWYRQSWQYTWHKARAAAGAPDTREHGMHALRHTAASAWLAGGVDIRTLAEWLGHADPGFTLRTYAHMMPDASTRGRLAMDAWWMGVSGEYADAPEMPLRARRTPQAAHLRRSAVAVQFDDSVLVQPDDGVG